MKWLNLLCAIACISTAFKRIEDDRYVFGAMYFVCGIINILAFFRQIL